MLSFWFLFYNGFEQIRGGKEDGGLHQAVLLNTWLNVFPFFYRATPVVLPGTGGSWQCCLWRTELSWRYWLWLPLKIALSPSDVCWYLWLAKDPDNMDFSCEWALKASRDRLYGGGTKGEGLFLAFQRFFQKWTALSDCVRHPSVASVCYPGYSPNLALSPVVLVKSEPLQSCATVRM